MQTLSIRPLELCALGSESSIKVRILGEVCVLLVYLTFCIELMQESCPFLIIIDNFKKIIYVGHSECMITATYNIFYNSQVIFQI